jgi:hypothetical protein
VGADGVMGVLGPKLSLTFFRGAGCTAIVDPSLSLSLLSRSLFLLSMIFALGLDARPAFVFLGLVSSIAAGVEGMDLLVSLIFGLDPPGVAIVGVTVTGALPTPVFTFNLSLRLMVRVVFLRAFTSGFWRCCGGDIDATQSLWSCESRW